MQARSSMGALLGCTNDFSGNPTLRGALAAYRAEGLGYEKLLAGAAEVWGQSGRGRVLPVSLHAL